MIIKLNITAFMTFSVGNVDRSPVYDYVSVWTDAAPQRPTAATAEGGLAHLNHRRKQYLPLIRDQKGQTRTAE